jgi:S-adenosylmethionine uptake transporter
MQALWMVAGSLAFTLMGAVIKLLASSSYSAFELVFWRGLVGIALMAAFLRWQRIPVHSPRLGMHASRSVVGTVAMFCWFYTLGPMTMGTAFTLNYTSPIFIALAVAAALWWRGERLPSRGLLYFSIAASFVGVLMILRPSVGQGQEFAFAIGLLGAVLSAAAYLQVRALGRAGESEWRTVFWFSVVNCGLGALATAGSGGWTPVAAADLPALLAIGVLAAIGQLCMTRAFGRGRTLLAANLQYSGVVFATALGWLLFGESHDLLELAGIALIVASGVGASLVPQGPVRPQALTSPPPAPEAPR